MLQFTTTTLINSLKDYTTGKDRITYGDDHLHIKRNGVFVNDETHKICVYKTEGHEGYLDTIDMSAFEEKEGTPCRLVLYIRSTGNADPMFANDFVFKGKPLFVEFDGTKANLHENLNKYLNATYDTTILEAAAEVDGDAADGVSTVVAVKTPATLTVEGSDKSTDMDYLVCTNEYMRIHKACVEEWIPCDKETCTHEHWSTPAEDGFVDLADSVCKGAEGFGSYNHLIKDFRLPTQANLRWKRTMEDEMPVAGALYTEFIVHYTVDRGLAGMGLLAQQGTSKTTHVYWVLSDLADKFEEAWTAIGAEVIDKTEGKTDDSKAFGPTADNADEVKADEHTAVTAE